MNGHVYRGHPGIGSGTIEGEALVAADGFSVRYDIDLKEGQFSRPAHKLYGAHFSNRIIALDLAKGGVASAWMLRVLMLGQHRPKALLLNRANPIMAQGASFAKMPLIDRFDCDITRVLRTGNRLRLTPETGCIEVLE